MAHQQPEQPSAPQQAPQIPNLLTTFRSSRPPTSSRSARGSRYPARGGNSNSNRSVDSDTAVQQTDDDASGSRLSAVEAGYLEDPFARAFYTGHGSVRRQPVINRGTYIRTTSLDTHILSFLSRYPSQPIQILSLGAGSDTRFFRLVYRNPSLATKLHYHEIDFPLSTKRKIECIQRDEAVLRVLKEAAGEEGVKIVDDGRGMRSRGFCVHGLDLRELGTLSRDELESKLGLEKDKPTLLLAECFLSYLPPTLSSTSTSNTSTTQSPQPLLLEQLARMLLPPPPTPLHILLYDPINPSTPFGRTMQSNLLSRSISLPGLEAYPTISAQCARLKDEVGCDEAGGMEVGTWWRERVSSAEKERLRAVEQLDEEEEWDVMGGQWGIVWGIRNGAGESDEGRAEEEEERDGERTPRPS